MTTAFMLRCMSYLTLVCRGFDANKAKIVVNFLKYSCHQTILKCPSLSEFQVDLEFIITFVWKQSQQGHKEHQSIL